MIVLAVLQSSPMPAYSEVSHCGRHSQQSVHRIAALFLIQFIKTPGMEFALFTAAAHWIDVFIEPSTMTPISLSWLITDSSELISTYVKLGFFLLQSAPLYIEPI